MIWNAFPAAESMIYTITPHSYALFHHYFHQGQLTLTLCCFLWEYCLKSSVAVDISQDWSHDPLIHHTTAIIAFSVNFTASQSLTTFWGFVRLKTKHENHEPSKQTVIGHWHHRCGSLRPFLHLFQCFLYKAAFAKQASTQYILQNVMQTKVKPFFLHTHTHTHIVAYEIRRN